jgi:hypothetical protein
VRSRSLGDASNYRWLGAGYGSTNTSATRSCSARGGASRSRRLRTPASTHGRLRGGRVTTATVAECAVKVSRNLGSCQQPSGPVRALAETRGAHVQPGGGHPGGAPECFGAARARARESSRTAGSSPRPPRRPTSTYYAQDSRPPSARSVTDGGRDHRGHGAGAHPREVACTKCATVHAEQPRQGRQVPCGPVP